MGLESISRERKKGILANEMLELKDKYKLLKDIAMDSNKDNKAYIEFLEFEFCKHVEEVINIIHSMK